MTSVRSDETCDAYLLIHVYCAIFQVRRHICEGGQTKSLALDQMGIYARWNFSLFFLLELISFSVLAQGATYESLPDLKDVPSAQLLETRS